MSRYIGVMPFLHLAVNDEPSPESMRAYLERNSIALLSNSASVAREVSDPPSDFWLGRFCPNPKVRQSGLWNRRHVDERYDPEFLNRLQELV